LAPRRTRRWLGACRIAFTNRRSTLQIYAASEGNSGRRRKGRHTGRSSQKRSVTTGTLYNLSATAQRWRSDQRHIERPNHQFIRPVTSNHFVRNKAQRNFTRRLSTQPTTGLLMDCSTNDEHRRGPQQSAASEPAHCPIALTPYRRRTLSSGVGR